MPTPTLRAYQLSAIERARAARRSGHRRILLSAPTGSGKSVIAAEIIRSAVESHGARVLVVGHRKELVDQFYVHLGRAGIVPGILRGQDERTNAASPVQVGTVQTLTRRELPPADMVIVDEAHRCPGESYAQILAAYPKATVFGLTATPARLDGKPLKEHFDVLVQVATYGELIESGDIVAPIVYAPRTPPNLSKVRVVAGDYVESELGKAMATVTGDIVKTWQEKSAGRRTVVFAAGIEHSQDLVEAFLDAGVKAAHLDGTTPLEQRDQLLYDLEVGRIQILSNVGVLCEGWDQPSVKCCVMARPTLSLTLWMQCAGRILRPWGELPPLLLDHAGNVHRGTPAHGLPHEDRDWSLDGEAKSPRDLAPARICKGCYAYVRGFPCPYCGHTEAVKPRKVETADGILERVDRQIAKEQAVNKDPKRAYFEAQAEHCRKKGFKPGAAAARYKDKFGDWPPWDWSRWLNTDYERDEYWQARVVKRAREREYWQDKSAPYKPSDAPANEEPAPSDEEYFTVEDL